MLKLETMFQVLFCCQISQMYPLNTNTLSNISSILVTIICSKFSVDKQKSSQSLMEILKQKSVNHLFSFPLRCNLCCIVIKMSSCIVV